MKSLPEPETLTPESARDVVRELRRHLRPQKLDDLRRLYREDDGSVESKARIFADEILLDKLDGYLMKVLPIIGREHGPLGWDTFRPKLRAVTRPGAGRIEADVEMAFSPENHECVHGPATIVPVMALARRLLGGGERVTAVDRITWVVPLLHQVRLRLQESAADGEPGPRAPKVAFHGRLRTSAGTRIDFSGSPLTGRPLLGQKDYNQVSLALVAGQKFDFGSDRESLAMALSEKGLELARRSVRHRPPHAAAILLDLVPIAILNWKRQRPMVACGYRNVQLPGPPSSAFPPETRLELRYRSDQSHPSARSGLWIGYYDFRYAPWQEDWSTMVMAEADDLQTLLRKLHS